MHDGAVIGRHFRSSQTLHLVWHNGLFTRCEPVNAPAREEETWIAPALFDPQVNGYAGVDFQRDDFAAGDLLAAAEQLQRAGCAQFLLTLVTNSWDAMLGQLQRCRELRESSSELRRTIAGWHIEGPFLSPEQGFCGAHDPKFMRDPTPKAMAELRAVVPNDPLLVTLAPERTGALESIEAAVSHGIKISLGHSNASAEQIRAARQAGAAAFTHLGNACPRALDRHDNILWRVLDSSGLEVSLIPDGIHVSPPLFRIIHRLQPKERIFYTTDAMAAAGAPPGRYTIGKIVVQVGADQIVRQPGQTNFAGSALRPIEGVFRAGRMLNVAWQSVWPGFSERPRAFMGLEAGFAAGSAANFCVLRQTESGTEARTYLNGAEVSEFLWR